MRFGSGEQAALRQQLVDDIPSDIGQPEIAALEPEGEFAKIPAERAPYCGVPIVDMHGGFESIVAVSVRRLQVTGGRSQDERAGDGTVTSFGRDVPQVDGGPYAPRSWGEC